MHELEGNSKTRKGEKYYQKLNVGYRVKREKSKESNAKGFATEKDGRRWCLSEANTERRGRGREEPEVMKNTTRIGAWGHQYEKCGQVSG